MSDNIFACFFLGGFKNLSKRLVQNVKKEKLVSIISRPGKFDKIWMEISYIVLTSYILRMTISNIS